MKKISNKIVAAIMVCVVAGTLIVGYISAMSAREAISEQVNQNMQSLSAQYAYEMETSLAHYEGVAQTIGTYIGATLSYSKAKNVTMSVGYFQELDRYLQEVSIQNPDLLSVSAFVNPDLAKAIFGSWFKGVDKVDYDPYDAYTEYSNGEEAWKWHQEILQRGEPLWSEPYFNQRFQEEIISYYYPIIDKEEEVIIAIVGVDIPFEEFRNMGTAISDKEPGGTMLIDQSNRIIVGSGHPQGTSLKDGGYGELEAALIQQGSGFRSMEVEGHGFCFVGFERLKSGFTFVVYSPQSQAFTSVRNTTFTIAVVSAGVIVLAMILAVVVGNSISKPIYLVIEDLLLMESGNFTGVKHRKYLKNKDETGKLAKALEVIQISMGEMVGIVNENSSVVAELVRKLEKIVERLMDRVSDVTQVSQELSAGMEQTSATAQNLSNTSEYMKQHMEAMKEKNEEGTASVNGIAQRAGTLNEEFNEDAKSAKELTKDVVIDLQASIEESKKVEQIKMLTEGILKIANETNLLSLNASIEAARAGIHGSGFGVVAKEISRMAEESRYTAQRIQNITMEVIDAVERLGRSSEKAMNFINGYIIDGYGKMMEVSEQYRMDSLDIKEIFVGFSAVSNDILNETEILNQAFYELKRTTSDGTKGTGDLLGNADQMSEITELVQKQSKELAEVFAKLKKAIGKFTI